MNRKYYIVLILILSVSVLLLGLSYSKDSSVNKYVNEYENYDRNLKIVSSDNLSNIVLDDVVSRDISVTNKGSYETSLTIEVLGGSLDNLYYQINNGEKEKIEDRVIYTEELSKLGDNGDHVSLNIKVFNENNEDKTISLKVAEKVKLLQDKIKEDSNVYKDEIDNYRYYGEVVNNYANYNGEEYQIVGLINNNIVLIAKDKETSVYQDNENYLTIYDYLASFNNSDVKTYNARNYQTWLNDSYWLLDTYGNDMAYYLDGGEISTKNKNTNLFARKLVKLAIDTEFILGDGSQGNPYEVVYDS